MHLGNDFRTYITDIQNMLLSRYVRMCCALMCNSLLTKEKRSYYCDELHSLSTDFGDHNLPILLAVFATAM